MAKDKDYRVVITGIYLKNGDFARGRTVVKGDQLIDLDKALESGYVIDEEDAKKADKEQANEANGADESKVVKLPKALTPAQQKKADDDKAKKDLLDANALYTEKFFSDAPKDSTLEQLNKAIEDDKPIEIL